MKPFANRHTVSSMNTSSEEDDWLGSRDSSDSSSGGASSGHDGAPSDADGDEARASAIAFSSSSSPPLAEEAARHENHHQQQHQQQPTRTRSSQLLQHRTANSSEASAAISAYSEALRTIASRRGSLSTGTQSVLSEETRRRHRDSKNRIEIAERTQQLLLQAHELEAVADDVPLWVHARVIPPRWRQQIVAHVAPLRAQMTFCQERVVAAWQLLLPPFDRANVAAFEARVVLYERSIKLLEAALVLCRQKAEAGEREAASGFLQRWYRTRLAKRGFYTRTVRLGRRERGLIPGLFDSTPGRSKLTLDRRTHQATLEFPKLSSPTSSPRAQTFR